MTRDVVNLYKKLELFQDVWSPRIVAELNDYQLKIAKFKDEFVWHDHSDTDEAFLVLEGKLLIEMKTHSVNLEPGELYVVPKGVLHKPSSAEGCSVLLIEPKGVVNTGEEESELTAENDVWV
ncbi:mannose-6-phosphate isomerase-like protein (cupin superfamily) [Alteromonadaceae bacterium 2753L.S.0a.02]|nr:mannose-6-phosphate isomerase-like protein (cupin superfamily) [Alteromonadaceae bacterium 2753L.S.0a.02]